MSSFVPSEIPINILSFNFPLIIEYINALFPYLNVFILSLNPDFFLLPINKLIIWIVWFITSKNLTYL